MILDRCEILSSNSSREDRSGRTDGGREEYVEEEVVEGIWSFK